MEVALEKRNPKIFLTLSSIVHLIAFVHFVVAVVCRYHYESYSTENEQVKRFAYNFKYVTTLNAVIQAAYNLFSFVTDVSLWSRNFKEMRDRLVPIRAFLRSSFAFPCGFSSCLPVLVALSIRMYVLSKPVHFERPLWLVFMLYLNGILFVMLDLLVCKCANPPWVPSLFCTMTLCFFYFIWEQIIYICTGVYANLPLLQEANTMSKICLYMALCFIWIMFLILGRCLNDVLWNHESQAYEVCTCKAHIAV